MQGVIRETPSAGKFEGLDQASSPTIPSQFAFFTKGVVEKNNILQRLSGKVAELKKAGDVFHIHFLPSGDYIIHVYGVGIVLVQ